jgi:glycosidase
MRIVHPIAIRLEQFPSDIATWTRCRQPLYEFHIHGDARKKYAFDESLYTSTGNVIFPNFLAVRQFAKKLNDQRDLKNHPEQAVKASQLNAMGLIDEINHYMLRRYEETENPGVVRRAMQNADQVVGHEKLQLALKTFGESFPPIEVHQGKLSLEKYLSQHAGTKPYSEVTLEEMILLWLANINPAFATFKELFDDHRLRGQTVYPAVIDSLEIFFASEKPVGSGGVSILELLRAPILASPHSLEGQLAYIKRHWGLMLSKHVLDKMVGAGDLIKEETKVVIPQGQQETVVPRYTRISPFGEIDEERFTADLDWMPNVVLIAKNTYVWLHQLSKKYSRSITTLDQIPDEELDQFARWNINALWLIGIWERSRASQTMKQMMGNPEAVASAYSVYDYEIANDLGGEQAFQNLRARAWHRGIRLAGDMVPNHVGLYSKWVIEHPEYFVQSEYSPFPNYSFTGANLSDRPGIELRIEDGYWTRRDAAVVFQRVDTTTGNVRYLYHGNDGTNTPWNDTAQLDFLKREVREAVIQTIFHVARKFSVIRFDAAMVLTKQHFQRLWYPQPGSGGDIPSRSDYAMTKQDFDSVFSNEFWREVVDRINSEMPNTLLLAEAFWLLEGYFVRTLGMHRVYNSAFMHMMMKEENSKYRELIKNTLAFNPEILKRYVNFMSNPDERTAIDQFGKEDKYFGVAMMMVAMPGLPMFAHGQIEGFTEKYGMEYQRAYIDEAPDQHLVDRHRQEIFPILKKRYLFSQVTNFEMYDVLDNQGNIMENVFCFSNRAGGERALFCFNNRYEACNGHIGGTVSKVQMDGTVSSGKIFGDSLGLRRDEHYYYVLKEHKAGLEYLRSGKELFEHGMMLDLQGFQYQLFCEFREVYDTTGEYVRLSQSLGGRGIPDIGQALKDLKLKPIHMAYQSLTGTTMASELTEFWFGMSNSKKNTHIAIAINSSYSDFLRDVFAYFEMDETVERWLHLFEQDIVVVKKYVAHLGPSMPGMESVNAQHRFVSAVFSWIVVRRLDAACQKQHVVDDLQLWDVVASEDLQSLRALMSHHQILSAIVESDLSEFVKVSDDAHIHTALNVNIYNGATFFSKERFEELIALLLMGALMENVDIQDGDKVDTTAIGQYVNVVKLLTTMAERSNYKLHDFRQSLISSHVKSHKEIPL